MTALWNGQVYLLSDEKQQAERRARRIRADYDRDIPTRRTEAKRPTEKRLRKIARWQEQAAKRKALEAQA